MNCWSFEAPVGCGWNLMPGHEGFCKILAALEPGSGFIRSYHRNVLKMIIVPEKVMDTGYQRRLRTNNNHFNPVKQNCFFYFLKILRVQRQICAGVRCPGISGTNKYSCDLFTLPEFPCKSMFPSA